MSTYMEAGEARLMRYTDGRWAPYGPVLPPVEDDDLHDLADGHRPVTWWHLPVSVDVQSGDRLICRERAWELLDRCGPNHHAVQTLSAHMHRHYDAEWAREWLAGRQVWSCRRAGGGGP